MEITMNKDIIVHRSLAEQVYSYIKKLILSGELKPGERIPEEKISKKLQVSRTPIREAYRRLAEYGLISIKPHNSALVINFDYADAEQIAIVRANIESLALRLLGVKITDEDCEVLERLSKDCLSLAAAGNLADGFEKDSQFHLEIAKRTGNKYLYDILERIDSKIQLERSMLCKSAEEFVNDVKQHFVIVQRLKERKIEAAVSIMQQHVMVHSENTDEKKQN